MLLSMGQEDLRERDHKHPAIPCGASHAGAECGKIWIFI